MNKLRVIKGEKHLLKSRIQIKKVTFILNILAFIILNFFLAFFINTQAIDKKVKSEYFFTADFQPNITAKEKEDTEIGILKLEGVRQVRYISKEEAFQKLQYELDVAIPRGENPLSDSLIIYFKKPSDIENIQVNLENNQSIKEVFVDAEYINYKDRQLKFYKSVEVGVFIGGILPMLLLIYYIFYSAVSIDYANGIGILSEKENTRLAKKVNLLPFTASSIIGTLIFFNIYVYFRRNLLLISNRYLLLGLKEIIIIELVIVLIINLLVWIKPIKIGVLKWVEEVG